MILCEYKDGILVITDATFSNMNELRKDMRAHPDAYREDHGFTLIEPRPVLYIKSTTVTKIEDKMMELP